MDPRTLVVLCLGAWTLLFAAGVSDGARILAVFPFPSKSHMMLASSMVKALGKRGHEVTMLQPNPDKQPSPNVNVLPIGNVLPDFFNDDMNIFDMKWNPLTAQLQMLMMGRMLVNATLRSPVVQGVINKPGQKFDMVLTELFFCQEGMIGLSYKLKAPMVALNPFGTFFPIDEVTGNPTNPAYVPHTYLDFTDHMNIFERTYNTWYWLISKISLELHHYFQNGYVQEFFPGAPHVKQLLKDNLALTLVNNHHSLFYPTPMSPNVIEIGGFHINHEAKPLPKSLQDFMDSAKDGVLYFSLGSNVKMAHLEDARKEALLSAFGDLKMRVLMKWDGPKPKTLPANVRLEEWFPQSDLFRHPNLRLFVTHGGLLSTQEAVFHGIPFIGMPVFADQTFNMRLAEVKGLAVQVDIRTVTKEVMAKALKEMIENPKYRQNVKKLSGVFRSQPNKAVDQALFWIDHVLEHGWEHLRPASTELCWAQLMLLDVLALSMLPVVLLLLCCRAVCCRGKKQAVRDTKKKNR